MTETSANIQLENEDIEEENDGKVETVKEDEEKTWKDLVCNTRGMIVV